MNMNLRRPPLRLPFLIFGLLVVSAAAYFPLQYASACETYSMDFRPFYSSEFCTPLGIFLRVFAIVAWLAASVFLVVWLYGSDLAKVWRHGVERSSKASPYLRFFHIERRDYADRRSESERRRFDDPGYQRPEKRGESDRRKGIDRRKV
jgi:hypothetical protein